MDFRAAVKHIYGCVFAAAFRVSLMDTKQIVVIVLKNPAFYAAVLALAHAVILYFWPDFPVSIMAAGDALIAVIASAITGQMVIADQQQRRAIANEANKPEDMAG